MLYNSHQQGLIIERCWLIYELVSDKLVPPDEFHIRYPSLVEFALTSGYFRLLVEIVVFLGVWLLGEVSRKDAKSQRIYWTPVPSAGATGQAGLTGCSGFFLFAFSISACPPPARNASQRPPSCQAERGGRARRAGTK